MNREDNCKKFANRQNIKPVSLGVLIPQRESLLKISILLPGSDDLAEISSLLRLRCQREFILLKLRLVRMEDSESIHQFLAFLISAEEKKHLHTGSRRTEELKYRIWFLALIEGSRAALELSEILLQLQSAFQSKTQGYRLPILHWNWEDRVGQAFRKSQILAKLLNWEHIITNFKHQKLHLINVTNSHEFHIYQIYPHNWYHKIIETINSSMIYFHTWQSNRRRKKN